MKQVMVAAGAISLATGAASAGGVERTTQSIGIIFEGGNYGELSFGSVTPRVSGSGGLLTPGVPSGNIAADYTQLGVAIKTVLNPNLDFGLIIESPFGADVDYPMTGYFASGSTAELNTIAITGVMRYKFPSNVSVIGGLRYQTLSADAEIPFAGGYTVTGAQDGGFGYLIGVAYEKPEIALRVALAYNSKIKHDLDTTEFGAIKSITRVETPESVNLEFQSGVAKDTLVFGSVRWVDWGSFKIAPINYPAATPLVYYNSDTVTYTLGVGRRFNENWSGAISVAFEGRSPGPSSNLGPTNGKRSLTIGATYTKDKMKITGGVSYVDLGDAETTVAGFTPAGVFTKNHAVGVGLKIGYSF